MPEIRAFFPCEAVVKRLNNSIDVLGFGIRSINIKVDEGEKKRQSVALTVFCQIVFNVAEAGKKEMQITLMSPDGRILSKVEMDYEIKVEKGAGEMNFHGPFPITPEESGRHAIQLILNGSEVARWPININIIRHQG